MKKESRRLGNVQETLGKTMRGSYNSLELPNGQWEELPVVWASGSKPGPTLLLTANIHGGEVIGTLVLHRFFELLKTSDLKGSVVAIPSLNPSGQIALTRFSAWDAVDPNRKWPEAQWMDADKKAKSEDWLNEWIQKEHLPGPQEQAWAKLFSDLEAVEPDFHVDLHSFTTNSIPFIFLDRFWYVNKPSEVEALAKKNEAMVKAIGFDVFIESSPANLVKTSMYRTTSSAVINNFRIPSCTIELGATLQAIPAYLDAAIDGLFNLLRWAGMYPGKISGLKNIPSLKLSGQHRVMSYPFAPCVGIIDPVLPAGSSFKKGDLLAVVRTISGEKIEEIRAEFKGGIIGWRNGIAKFKNAPLAWIAAEDKLPLVCKWIR
jgi:predicted deacylase